MTQHSSNTRVEGVPKVKQTLEESFAAYDKLPPELRTVLQNIHFNTGVVTVHQAWLRLGTAETINTIHKECAEEILCFQQRQQERYPT